MSEFLTYHASPPSQAVGCELAEPLGKSGAHLRRGQDRRPTGRPFQGEGDAIECGTNRGDVRRVVRRQAAARREERTGRVTTVTHHHDSVYPSDRYPVLAELRVA
jgi:hypothetical protein